jgi:hypothetical protein
VYKENRTVFPFCIKIWWQSFKTFQKVNYVTCSLVFLLLSSEGNHRQWNVDCQQFFFNCWQPSGMSLATEATWKLAISKWQCKVNFQYICLVINKIFPLSVYKENRTVFPFCIKIWWQSFKTFQKVNYVTCSLVLWKYRFGVTCTKMLQIQRKLPMLKHLY